MKLRVSLAVKSTFTSVALRSTLAKAHEVELLGEERSCAGAEKLLLAHPAAIAVIDLELLAETGGPSLQNLIAARREPTLLINARGAAVPDVLRLKSSVHVLSGRHAGELDIGHIQANLHSAILEARMAKAQIAPTFGAVPRETLSSVGTASIAFPSSSSTKRMPELVVIGVSTGGPTLLIKLLKDIATPTIPTLIAQHMPAGETAGFALRLSEVSGHQVVEVGRGSLPPVGAIGVVQGGMDFQISLAPNGQMRLREASVPGNPFHPSIDHLLSTAASAGIPTHTVILTGMGQDGSVGALALSQQGYPVVAQRPETCAVAGMPSAAIQNGSARFIQSPEQIVETINRWFASVKSGALSSAS